jgi:tetratricopeptide (TPR) repeat protein
MKNIIFLAFLFVGFSLNAQIKTPAPSPSAKVEQMVGLTTVSLEYSRPAVKDRDIFSANGLVPFGKVWRTGANQATKITFDTAVKIDGNEVPAGSYAVLSIPSATSWAVHFYNYDKSSFSSYLDADPALIVKTKPMKLNNSIESFTIAIDNISSGGAHLTMAWDKTKVAIPMTVDSDGTVMANIERVMAGPSKGDYYNAAAYYQSTGKDMNKALEWINIATAGDDPKFWQVRRKALILADLGKTKEAIAAAQMSLDLAKKAGNDDYVSLNEKSIKEWKMMKK